ncbi:MAG: ATP-binding protein [Chitinophagaceae bacterium]
MQEKLHITIFLGLTTLLILLLGGAIIVVVYVYQQKRLVYQNTYNSLKLQYEKNLIASQLEVQENMFRHISQEIHDNIGLTLSLVKLQLNTMDIKNTERAQIQISSSIDLLGESIGHLKNISKSLNSDIINSYGLTKAVEIEIAKVEESSPLKIDLTVMGDPCYMDSQKELIIFRMIQESFNNIIKHSHATKAELTLEYLKNQLFLTVSDNGKGFIHSTFGEHSVKGKAGLKNMESRSKMIRGEMSIDTKLGHGTTLKFTIPI